VKRIKIAVFIGLALVLVIGTVLAGCGGTPAPTKEDPLILRWIASGAAGRGPVWALMEEGKAAIEEATGGTVVLELYGEGQLCESSEIAEAIRMGVGDIGWIHPSYTPGLLPMTELVMIPLVWPTGDALIQFNTDVIADYLEDEWADAGLRMMFPPLGEITRQLFTKDPLRTMDDFEGVEVSATSASECQMLDLLGFSAIQIPGSESYVSLEKGVTQAALMFPWAAEMSQYADVCDYVTMINFCSNEGFIGWAMNPDRYNDLPSDIREILTEELARISIVYNESQGEWDEAAMANFTAGGMEVITLSEADYALMRQKAQSLIEDWVEDAVVEDAQEFADYCLSLRDKYETE
jgi:TRAP-type C4-dicarboxylate transport system substrate-binding protein